MCAKRCEHGNLGIRQGLAEDKNVIHASLELLVDIASAVFAETQIAKHIKFLSGKRVGTDELSVDIKANFPSIKSRRHMVVHIVCQCDRTRLQRIQASQESQSTAPVVKDQLAGADRSRTVIGREQPESSRLVGAYGRTPARVKSVPRFIVSGISMVLNYEVSPNCSELEPNRAAARLLLSVTSPCNNPDGIPIDRELVCHQTVYRFPCIENPRSIQDLDAVNGLLPVKRLDIEHRNRTGLRIDAVGELSVVADLD